jgi:DNA-binding transcriptional ArsR family regulator
MIQEKPGIHLRKLQRELDCTSTTLNYHLGDLDVKERNIRGYRRFYPSRTPEKMERPLAALNHDVRGPMIYHIDSGSSPSELVEKLDVSKSTVSSHLKILEEDGLVREEKDGRRKKLSATEDTRKTVKDYASRILEEATEGFIEMWE